MCFYSAVLELWAFLWNLWRFLARTDTILCKTVGTIARSTASPLPVSNVVDEKIRLEAEFARGRRQHWSGWGREGCYIEKVTKKESSSFLRRITGMFNTFPVNINRCPKVFCTRLYPNNEKIGYTFHKNGHNSRTVKGNHIIFSGLKVYEYTFIVL